MFRYVVSLRFTGQRTSVENPDGKVGAQFRVRQVPVVDQLVAAHDSVGVAVVQLGFPSDLFGRI